MNNAPFDLLLFDLGGVLVDNAGPERLTNWLPTELTIDQILDLWLMSSSVRAFESGQIGSQEFAGSVVEELSLSITPQQFLVEFPGWVKTLYPGGKALLKKLSARYKLACLSNTNELHWQQMCQHLNLDSTFDYTFLSFKSGLLKPNPEVFFQVIDQTSCQPERILYFDDSQRNIDSAETVGLKAVKVVGAAQVYAALLKIGVIDE